MRIAKCLCKKTLSKTQDKYCSKTCFYFYRKRPSGLKYNIVSKNKAWFKRGVRSNLKGEFKKGHLPWNEGRSKGYINFYGYKCWWNDDKDYLEHRKVLEEHLGRKLKSEEIVHHIDGDKQNNDLNNLQIMTR